MTVANVRVPSLPCKVDEAHLKTHLIRAHPRDSTEIIPSEQALFDDRFLFTFNQVNVF